MNYTIRFSIRGTVPNFILEYILLRSFCLDNDNTKRSKSGMWKTMEKQFKLWYEETTTRTIILI